MAPAKSRKATQGTKPAAAKKRKSDPNKRGLTTEEKKRNHITSEGNRRSVIRKGYERLATLVSMDGEGKKENQVLQRAIKDVREILQVKEGLKQAAMGMGMAEEEFEGYYAKEMQAVELRREEEAGNKLWKLEGGTVVNSGTSSGGSRRGSTRARSARAASSPSIAAAGSAGAGYDGGAAVGAGYEGGAMDAGYADAPAGQDPDFVEPTAGAMSILTDHQYEALKQQEGGETDWMHPGMSMTVHQQYMRGLRQDYDHAYVASLPPHLQQDFLANHAQRFGGQIDPSLEQESAEETQGAVRGYHYEDNVAGPEDGEGGGSMHYQ